jgi:starch phosphorylase
VGGQALIRQLHEFSMQPAFAGRLFLVENYDIALARRLVTGVDIWLNNPEYPLEASGTSGMKAAMNGAVHLSILDGWWAEGFTGDNGYGVAPMGAQLPEHERNRLEADEICRLLFEVAKPCYFERGGRGYAPAWVKLAKTSQRTVLPRFNAERQVIEYAEKFYAPALRHARTLAANGFAGARELAAWKARVAVLWPALMLRLDEGPPATLEAGASFTLSVAVTLGELGAADVHVECQLGVVNAQGKFEVRDTLRLLPAAERAGETLYSAVVTPALSGLAAMRIRAWPTHPLLAHRFEVGRMRWL